MAKYATHLKTNGVKTMESLLKSLEDPFDGKYPRVSAQERMWNNQQKIASAFDAHTHITDRSDFVGHPIFPRQPEKTLLEAVTAFLNYYDGHFDSTVGKNLRDAVEREEK